MSVIVRPQTNTFVIREASDGVTVRPQTNSVTLQLAAVVVSKAVFARGVWTGNAVTTSRTTAFTFQVGSLMIFLNGILQKKDSDYTEKSGQTGYDMTVAPPSSWEVEERYVQA